MKSIRTPIVLAIAASVFVCPLFGQKATQKVVSSPATLLNAYLDSRFEAEAGASEALLTGLAGFGVESPAGLEALLLSPRAAYPDSAELISAYTTHSVDCYHVDYSSKFVLYVPKDFDPQAPAPLVVVGHGGNSSMSAERAMKVAQQYIRIYAPGLTQGTNAIIAAPASERGWGPIGYSLVFSTISKIKRMVPIDSNRIYLTGQSMGGHLTYRMALMFGDRFGAVSPHSGGYDFVEKGSIGNLLNVPGRAVFGSTEPYGINGDNKANGTWAKAHGLDWSFVEKDGGHTIYEDELPGLAEFFLERPRDPYPKRVYLKQGGSMLFTKTWGIKGLLSDNYTYPLTTTTLTHPDPGFVRDDRGTSSTQRKDPNALQRCPSEEIDGRIQQDRKNLHGGFEGRNEPQDCGEVREGGQVPIGPEEGTDLEDAA